MTGVHIVRRQNGDGMCHRCVMTEDLEARIETVTLEGPTSEWLLEVSRTSDGWLWRRPIVDEATDYIVDLQSWTTDGPLLANLVREWPALCDGVTVDGLQDTQAKAFLAPAIAAVIAPDSELTINGQRYQFDGANWLISDL